MRYIAIAIKDKYWVVLSKPCSMQEAEEFRGCELMGETFAIKTEEEVQNYKSKIE
jgi:hypothetical protein